MTIIFLSWWLCLGSASNFGSNLVRPYFIQISSAFIYPLFRYLLIFSYYLFVIFDGADIGHVFFVFFSLLFSIVL